MKTYPTGFASRKPDEPARVKVGGITTTLHEIAKALKGYISGEWINIRGPGHSSNDRSLGIKLDKTAKASPLRKLIRIGTVTNRPCVEKS